MPTFHYLEIIPHKGMFISLKNVQTLIQHRFNNWHRLSHMPAKQIFPMIYSNSTKLFLVDADSFSIALYEQHIRNLGYSNVITLTSGNINIHQLYHYPGIILLEYRLASNNGFELIRNIKKSNPGVYVVLVTGKSKIIIAEEALHYGAFDIVVTGQYFQASLAEVLDKIQFSEAVEGICETEIFAPERPLYVHPDGSISHYVS